MKGHSWVQPDPSNSKYECGNCGDAYTGSNNLSSCTGHVWAFDAAAGNFECQDCYLRAPAIPGATRARYGCPGFTGLKPAGAPAPNAPIAKPHLTTALSRDCLSCGVRDGAPEHRDPCGTHSWHILVRCLNGVDTECSRCGLMNYGGVMSLAGCPGVTTTTYGGIGPTLGSLWGSAPTMPDEEVTPPFFKLPDEFRRCRACARELSTVLDAYFGRDDYAAKCCSKCRRTYEGGRNNSSVR